MAVLFKGWNEAKIMSLIFFAMICLYHGYKSLLLELWLDGVLRDRQNEQIEEEMVPEGKNLKIRDLTGK